MTVTYAIDAASCPAPQFFDGPLILISANAVSGVAPTTPHALSTPQGTTTTFPALLNANWCREDLGGSVYAVPFSVCFGLGLQPGSGLSLLIAAGHANINGITELASQATKALAASSTLYIWIGYNAVQAAPVIFVETTTTPPLDPAVYLGQVITSGGAITAIDGSGVCYDVNGVIERIVGDVGVPGDTPPSAWRGWTRNSVGNLYWWNGSVYSGFSGSSTVRNFEEQPSGLVNTSNQLYTLSNTPVTNSLLLTKNGLRMIPTTDYTLSGTSITTTVAPISDSQGTDFLYAQYQY